MWEASLTPIIGVGDPSHSSLAARGTLGRGRIVADRMTYATRFGTAQWPSTLATIGVNQPVWIRLAEDRTFCGLPRGRNRPGLLHHGSIPCPPASSVDRQCLRAAPRLLRTRRSR